MNTQKLKCHYVIIYFSHLILSQSSVIGDAITNCVNTRTIESIETFDEAYLIRDSS